MANDNFVQIIGTVTRDPELRFTAAGVAVCSFGLAWNPRRKNANGEWENGDPTFFSCSAWRDLGENIAASITKGTRVVVTGTVAAREYDDRDGNKRQSIDIQVEACGPSLRWATAQVEKTERGGGGGNRPAQTPGNPSPYGDNEEPF